VRDAEAYQQHGVLCLPSQTPRRRKARPL
jgi:hypothetical protein